jgi:autotransporter-associated beta strand protein
MWIICRLRTRTPKCGARVRASRRPTSRFHPRLEGLEERTLPSGLFGDPIVSSPGGTSPPGNIITGDFNGDGKLDVCTLNYVGGGGLPASLSILLGNGSGGFTPATGSPIDNGNDDSLSDGVAADFDGDGKIDLAVVDSNGGAVVQIWHGNGDGTFTKAGNFGVENAKYGIVAADFNGDNKPDLAVADPNDAKIWILLNDGTGHFTASPSLTIPGSGARTWLTVGDFNGDGVMDLAGTLNVSSDVYVLQGKGDGTFNQTADSPYHLDIVASAMAVTELNRDGKPDLAAVGFDGKAGAIQAMIAQGGQTAVKFSLHSAIEVSAAPSGFNSLAASAVNAARQSLVNDYDGDGNPDIFAAVGTSSARALLGDGLGGFTDGGAVTLQATGNQINAVIGGDFNGDGRADVAVLNGSGGNVDVLLNQTPAPAVSTSVTLQSSANPSVFGQPVTFTAAVQWSGNSTPTGTVAFEDGINTLATIPLDGSGRAAFTTTAPLGIGSHAVTATYSGNSNFNGSTSAVFTQTVRKATTVTWSGGGPDNLWTDGANWVGAVTPAPGDHLVFPAAAAQQVNVNDFPTDSMFYSLTFTPATGIASLGTASYRIGGNRIVLGAGGIIDQGIASNNTLSLDINLSGTAAFITLRSASDIVTVHGRISDASVFTAGIVKSGPGQLILGVTNSYVGPTIIARGELDVLSTGGLGRGAVTARAGTTLRLQSGAILANPLALAGTLASATGGGTWAGPIALATGTGAATLNATGVSTLGGFVDNPLVLSGTISGNPDTGLDKKGLGTVILRGHNAYRGHTFVRQGTLSLQNSGALYIFAINVDVSAGATLELSGGIAVATSVVLDDPTATLRSTNGNNTLKGQVALHGKNSILVQSDQLEIAGQITGSGTGIGIFKAGTGTLVLSSASSVALATEVAAGVLDLRNTYALGVVTGGTVQVDDGATLALAPPSGPRGSLAVFSQSVSVTGTGFENQGALHALKSCSWSGTAQLKGPTATAVDAGSSLSLGNVTGDSLLKVGDGVLDLVAANGYSGDTIVAQGTLVAHDSHAFGLSDVTVSGGATLKLQPPVNPSPKAAPFAVSNSLTILDGSTLEAAPAPANPRLPQAGPSPITWSGSLTYAGRVNVIVDQNQSLSLSGFVGGTDGAALVKGGGGALTLSGGASGAFATVLDQNALNQLVVQSGTVSFPAQYASLLTVSVADGFVPAINQQFVLIDNQTSNAIVGTFLGAGSLGGLTEGATFAMDGFTFRITYHGGDGNDVVITRVA